VRNVSRILGAVGALGAAVAFFALQRSGSTDVRDDTLVRPPKELPVSPVASAAGSIAGGNESRPASNETDSREPTYATPAEIERQILQLIAERRPSVLSINSVNCGPTDCEVALLGTNSNPRVVDAQGGFGNIVISEHWRDFRILSSGMSTRETAPGAREYVVTFTYQPLVDLSADPATAARQQAACAAAWRRQTTNPTPADYVRQYLDIADQHLALAAAQLGADEAERIARETNLGPLIRECGLQPP
jgi:hypothetical protein